MHDTDTKAVIARMATLSRWQTVAEMRAAVAGMPVVRYGIEAADTTYLDIYLKDGNMRLSGDWDTEWARLQNERGYTHCIELPRDMPGRRLADALTVAEARMPEVVAGFGEDDEEGGEMWAGLTTDESVAALMAIRAAISPDGDKAAA